MDSAPPPNVAIVIGSGMAGLAAAQVLTDHFERVLLVERDHPEANNHMSAVEMAQQTAEEESRPGVTQYKQLHGMLGRGLQEYDSIFQDRYTKALKAAGGNVGNQYETYLFCHPLTGPVPWLRLRDKHTKGESPSAICTRHLFETTARQLLSENPRVQVVYGATVSGLLFEGDSCGQGATAAAAAAGAGCGNKQGLAVTGVRLSDGRCLSGQLVVDCSGRGSNLPSWLAAAGYKRPRMTRAGCNTGYTNWFVRLDPEHDRIFKQHNIYLFTAIPAAPERTCTMFMRCEGDAWLAGVGGNEGDYPGTDPQEIKAFAEQKLWHPATARLLAGATQLGPASHKHGLMSTWRHYEEVDVPDGLVVLGDAICSFNPLYGQGMTVAALEVSTLRQLLSQRAAKHKHTPCLTSGGGSDECGSGSSSSTVWLRGLNKQLQKAILPTIQLSWQLAVGGDMRYPSATCNEKWGSGPGQRLVMGYFDLLFKYAATDPVVHEAFLRVVSMLDGPGALFTPSVLSHVLLNKLMEYVPPAVTVAVQKAVQQYGSWLGVSSVRPGGGKGGRSTGYRHPEALMELLGVLEGDLHPAVTH